MLHLTQLPGETAPPMAAACDDCVCVCSTEKTTVPLTVFLAQFPSLGNSIFRPVALDANPNGGLWWDGWAEGACPCPFEPRRHQSPSRTPLTLTFLDRTLVSEQEL